MARAVHGRERRLEFLGVRTESQGTGREDLGRERRDLCAVFWREHDARRGDLHQFNPPRSTSLLAVVSRARSASSFERYRLAPGPARNIAKPDHPNWSKPKVRSTQIALICTGPCRWQATDPRQGVGRYCRVDAATTPSTHHRTPFSFT
ncbi:hypothetical protein FRAHR75_120092 [Frankia sp. Hr75.2]|nr:hypothetical protein FRAHR75_120092 [Frankia sp. Hr75.2]